MTICGLNATSKRQEGQGQFFQHCWVPCLLLLACLLLNGLTACSLPQVSAEDRLYLDLSLEYIDAYPLPQQTFDGKVVDGFSALAYDRRQNQVYALSVNALTEAERNSPSDQPAQNAPVNAPVEFYTLTLTLDPAQSKPVSIESMTIEAATVLRNEGGEPYTRATLDPTGITLSPQPSIFITSEGMTSEGRAGESIVPFIEEFDLDTGEQRQGLPLPKRYFPLPDDSGAQPGQGIQPHRGLNALTLSPGSSLPAAAEPFRLFAATAAPLVQNRDRTESRLLHYLLSEGPPLLIAEYLYPLDTDDTGAIASNLVALAALDQGGHFLSLERTTNPSNPSSTRIFQLATGGATDISAFSDQIDLPAAIAARKQLLLNLNELSLPPGDVTGMALGPRLPDGSQSLLLVRNSDRNSHGSQLLIFRLQKAEGRRQRAEGRG